MAKCHGQTHSGTHCELKPGHSGHHCVTFQTGGWLSWSDGSTVDIRVKAVSIDINNGTVTCR